jgi:hypothetical protein
MMGTDGDGEGEAGGVVGGGVTTTGASIVMLNDAVAVWPTVSVTVTVTG